MSDKTFDSLSIGSYFQFPWQNFDDGEKPTFTKVASDSYTQDEDTFKIVWTEQPVLEVDTPV